MCSCAQVASLPSDGDEGDQVGNPPACGRGSAIANVTTTTSTIIDLILNDNELEGAGEGSQNRK